MKYDKWLLGSIMWYAFLISIVAVLLWVTYETYQHTKPSNNKPLTVSQRLTTLETWADQITPEVNINSHMTRGEQEIYFNEIADSRCYQCHTGGK